MVADDCFFIVVHLCVLIVSAPDCWRWCRLNHGIQRRLLGVLQACSPLPDGRLESCTSERGVSERGVMLPACRPQRGISECGVSERGVAERGVSYTYTERGVAERGVAERGVAERGVAERGVAERGGIRVLTSASVLLPCPVT